MRAEADAYDAALVEQLGFDPQVFFEKPKAMAIMTNSLSENLVETHKVYGDLKYKKHVLSSDTTAESFLSQFP